MKLREQLINTVTDRSMMGASEIAQPETFGKYVNDIVDGIMGETQLQEIAHLEHELAMMREAFKLVDGTLTNYSPEQLNIIKRAREYVNDD